MAKKTSKKTTRKKTSKKTTASRGTATKASSKATASTRAAAQAPGRKAKVEPRAKKTTAAKPKAKPAAKTGQGTRKGKCDKSKCDKGKCSARKLDGRSLLDRARECKDLEECRGFIRELGQAVEQANTWLDEMHTQALSAEHTRDLYGEQISDLMEAITADERRIAQLEKELEKERAKPAAGKAPKAALDQLTALHKEVRAIKADLRRLLAGEAPTAERRRRVRQAAREEAGEGRGRGGARGRGKAKGDTAPAAKGRAPMEGRPAKRAMNERAGPFAKYSVLRGAACSLGVGKYGYPPDVCAPAAFSRSEAAEILGTYAQNKYAGLAKWALITGLPIDDVVVPLVPAAPQGQGKRRASKKTSSTSRRKKTAKVASNDEPRTMAARASSRKPAKSGRSNQQIIDQVLLTVARI